MATAGPTAGGAGARARARPSTGEGRGCGCVSLRSTSAGSSRRVAGVLAAVHPRARERRLGRDDGARCNGFRARRSRHRVRPMGLRLVHELPTGNGELLRDTGEAEPGRAGWHRRRHGRVSPRPLDPLSDPARQLGSAGSGPAHGRGADQLSRRETVGASARAGLDRGGDRRRGSGPDGDSGAQGARPRRQPLWRWTLRKTS